MINEEQLLSDSLHQKLPPQHWVLRYSSLLVALLMASLLAGMYWINIPQYMVVEIHPVANTQQYRAIAAQSEAAHLAQGQTIAIQLENGRQVQFDIHAMTVEQNHLHLLLDPVALEQQDQAFLTNEYITTGKIKKGTQSLIHSLFTT